MLRQERAVALLAAGRTVAETAEAVGVRAEQVSRWRGEPGFADAVSAAATKSIEGEVETLKRMGLQSLRVIEQLRDDEDAPHAVRLSAARDLADRGGFKPREDMDITSGGKTIAPQVLDESKVAEHVVRLQKQAKGDE